MLCKAIFLLEAYIKNREPLRALGSFQGGFKTYVCAAPHCRTPDLQKKWSGGPSHTVRRFHCMHSMLILFSSYFTTLLSQSPKS